jgi:DNA uptake protein ComE-like DNA-binding protein
MSASKIEELIERKVSEALANRVLNQPAANPPAEISEAVQRRLEALEKKIEDGDAEDARAEGLRFLLMAKQHKERGEDHSALKMYEMAVPFFPGQEKLQKKIENLRAKISAKREAEAASRAPVDVPAASKYSPVAVTKRTGLATAPIAAQLPTPAASFEISQPQAHAKSRRTKTEESDDEYNGSAIINGGDYGDDDSFSYKPTKPKKPKSKSVAKSTLRIFADEADTESSDAPQTPRTRHLLDIINSRDVALIKGLSGIGGKKARDLVEFLELQSEDDGGNIRDLQQLRTMPGMGVKTVERAYDGIAALLV